MDGGNLTAVPAQNLFQGRVAGIHAYTQIPSHKLNDLVAAAFQKSLCGQPASLFMVRMDHGDILSPTSVHGNDGPSLPFDKVRRGISQSNQAVYNTFI